MPKLVTLEIKRTVQVIVPYGHPSDTTRQLVADAVGGDIGASEVTITGEMDVTLAEAADETSAARLNDAGTGFTVDETEWIEGRQ